MTKNQIRAALALILTLAVVILFQFRTNARLKQELMVLNERAPNPLSSPQSEVIIGSGPEVPEGAANSDERELLKLREEAATLREKVQSMRRAHESLNEKEALWRRLGGENFEIESIPGSPFVPGRYYAKELWSDAELATAPGCLQAVLWAVRSGNISRYSEAQKWRENLTPEQKALIIERMQNSGFSRHPAADAIGIKITSAEGSEDSRKTTYNVVLDRGEDLAPRHASFHFENMEGTWRLNSVVMAGESPGEYVVPR